VQLHIHYGIAFTIELYEAVLFSLFRENCREFLDYYDALQEQISQLSVMDDLLTAWYVQFITVVVFKLNASLNTRLGEEESYLM